MKNPALPLAAVAGLALTLTACDSTDIGSAIGTTDDGRPVYAFPSDDTIRQATAQAQEREDHKDEIFGPADWGDIYDQRRLWNGQADYTCTRLKDGHSLGEIAEDSYGPLIAPEDKRARLQFVIEQACPELAK